MTLGRGPEAKPATCADAPAGLETSYPAHGLLALIAICAVTIPVAKGDA